MGFGRRPDVTSCRQSWRSELGRSATTYTYDPTRGGFHVATRTDPIVGAQASTSFAYDVYNRRTSVTDVNGLETLTEYDELDRVVRVTAKGLTPAEDLLTENIHNAFGDLFQTVLPRGNVLEYAYDSAGRLISMERNQTDAVGNVTQIAEASTCGSVPDLVLQNQTVSTTEVFESCASITASDFQVEASGNATLRAAGTVALGSGFSVASEGRLVIEAGADLSTSRTRTYEYQDVQYFLTGASGPWGSLAWSYDKIGNRLSELRDGQLPADTYHYVPNAALGNTAQLGHIDLSVGGTRDYAFGPAGHLEEVQAGANLVDFDSDDEGRMASLTRFAERATFTYDGRSFLASATEVGGDFVEATYSSEGLLYSLFGSQDGGVTTSTRHVFYFASRPVTTMEADGAALVYTFLSTDHLGTPWVATALNGQVLWSGGFEPFGRDWQKGTSQDAQENGIFLRFPGQWFDGTWEGASLGAEVFYNVHRWYLSSSACTASVET